MKTPSKILVATDFSDTADHAFEVAAGRAKAFGAELTAVHVYNPMPNVPPIVWSHPKSYEESIAKEVAEAVTKTLNQKSADLLSKAPNVSLRVIEHESPGAAILQLAEEEGVDLIIVGSHRRTGVPRMLLGSVAEKVVRHGPCSVLVVRPPE